MHEEEKSRKFKPNEYGGQSAEHRHSTSSHWVVLAAQDGAESA
jgi:hypothetical protein